MMLTNTLYISSIFFTKSFTPGNQEGDGGERGHGGGGPGAPRQRGAHRVPRPPDWWPGGGVHPGEGVQGEQLYSCKEAAPQVVI